MEHRFNVAAWNNFDYSQGVFYSLTITKCIEIPIICFHMLKYIVLFTFYQLCALPLEKNIDAIFHHKL